MQELASVNRARDYTAHLEDKVARESGFVEYLLLTENLKTLSEIETKIYKESEPILAEHLRENLEQVREIEANLRTEAWTVATKLDTIMLKLWLEQACKYQTDLSKTVSHRKGGKLDWETNESKLTPIVTKSGAQAPEPIQLTTGMCFSSPMVSMGKRETNVNKLKNLRLNALKENKEKIDAIIDLYQSGKMPNYLTAENMIERLANKTKRKDYLEKTQKEFTKLVNKYGNAESVKGILERSREKRRVRNVMVTMILYREKESDKAEKQREA
jgi:hypothetical protein